MTKIQIGGELYSSELQNKVVDTEQVKDITRDNLSQTEINDDIETNATYSEDGDYIISELHKTINAYTIQESNDKFATKTQVSTLFDYFKILEKRIRILEAFHNIENDEIIPDEPNDIQFIGTFTYPNITSAGGTFDIASNTLQLKKNNVVQNVPITYTVTTGNTFVSILNQTGQITVDNNTGNARNIVITATCSFEGWFYVKTANITQEAYTTPTETTYTYIGWAKTNAGVPLGISDFVSKKQTNSTTKTVNVTVNETVNTIVVLCPSNMSLTLCESQVLKEDISSLMTMTNVTYNEKAYKMYQYRYGSSINGTEFKINFN